MFDDLNFPNVLTICGSGRNVGKTYMGCQIIKHFSQNSTIVAVKISKFNHQHSEEEGMKIIHHSDGFQIWKQISITNKDSGRYLNSGTLATYYIECDEQHLLEAFLKVYKMYGNSCLMVCESASITNYIKPAIAIFVESINYPTELNKRYFKNQCTLVLNERSNEISNPQLVIKTKNNNWFIVEPYKMECCYG